MIMLPLPLTKLLPGRAPPPEGRARLRCPGSGKTVGVSFVRPRRGEQTMRKPTEPIENDDTLQRVHCIHCGKTLGRIELGTRCALWCPKCNQEYLVTLQQDGALQIPSDPGKICS